MNYMATENLPKRLPNFPRAATAALSRAATANLPRAATATLPRAATEFAMICNREFAKSSIENLPGVAIEHVSRVVRICHKRHRKFAMSGNRAFA